MNKGKGNNGKVILNHINGNIEIELEDLSVLCLIYTIYENKYSINPYSLYKLGDVDPLRYDAYLEDNDNLFICQYNITKEISKYLSNIDEWRLNIRSNVRKNNYFYVNDPIINNDDDEVHDDNDEEETNCNMIMEDIIIYMTLNIDVTLVDKNGNTPLHLVCNIDSNLDNKKFNYDICYMIIKILLYKKANINAVNKNNMTPLFFYLEQDERSNMNMAIVELLLDTGTDISISDSEYNMNLLHNICLFGYDKILELLLNDYNIKKNSWIININQQDNLGWTPILFGCEYEHERVVELLMNKNPDIHLENNEEWSAYKAAMTNNSYKIKDLILNSIK